MTGTAVSFTLLPFDYAHLPELADLWIMAWQKAMPSIDFEARRGWFVDRVIALNDGGTDMRLAFDASTGTMAGFVTLDRGSGHVDQLAVAPAYWGTQCARGLLAWARDAVRQGGGGRLFLDVNQDNPRAVRLYEREGFVRMGEGTNPQSGLKTWRYAWREA